MTNIIVSKETLSKIVDWIENREHLNGVLALKHLLEHSPVIECPSEKEQQLKESETKANWYVS